MYSQYIIVWIDVNLEGQTDLYFLYHKEKFPAAVPSSGTASGQ